MTAKYLVRITASKLKRHALRACARVAFEFSKDKSKEAVAWRCYRCIYDLALEEWVKDDWPHAIPARVPAVGARESFPALKAEGSE